MCLNARGVLPTDRRCDEEFRESMEEPITSISMCRKRSFATYRNPHSVGWLAPPARYHSCTTSSEEPPLSTFNSQWDIPVIGDSSANFR